MTQKRVGGEDEVKVGTRYGTTNLPGAQELCFETNLSICNEDRNGGDIGCEAQLVSQGTGEKESGFHRITTTMSESFTIQISTNLVNKLADEGERLKKKPKKPRKKTPQAPQQSQNRVHQKQISDALETKRGAPAAGWPFQPPVFLPASPPTQIPNEELDAIRTVLQESEKVVDRLQKQEDNMVQEVTQRAKELHEKEFKLPYQKPMPCLLERDACLQCYKEHANDPLKCAHVVKAFADCARKVRQQVVD